MNLILTAKSQIIDFFTKGHRRSIEAKRNIAASFIIKGVSIAISLMLVPLTIHYVNPTQYGIWLTLSSVVSWFSFFDIGFGNGLRNRFAEAKATGNTEKARIYVSTTYAVLTIIFTAVWLMFLGANSFLNWSKILNAPPQMAAELSTLALIVFTFFCMQIILKTVNTVLIADQKPAKAASFDTLGQLFALIIIFVLTKKTSGSLTYLGLALGFTPIIVYLIASLFLFNGKYKKFAPTFKKINFSYAKEILSLGIKFFLIQISAIVIFQTTNIVITQVLRPEQVTIYNIVYKYFFILSMAFTIILSPFWSAFTEAYMKQDFNWMQNTIKKLKRIWLLSIPIVVIMVLLSSTIYYHWIGNIVTIPFSVSISMAVYVLFFTRFNLFIYLINGIGKLRLQLIINVTICIIYIPISVLACKSFGIGGIICANILVSIIHALVSQIQVSKIMNNKATGIWNK